MGGFGAYDIALQHPGRFCAVGGHSPALWFDGGETAPGAFDDAADFERNDVVGTVEGTPTRSATPGSGTTTGPKTLPRLRRRLRSALRADGRRPQRPLLAGRPRGRLLEQPLGRLPALLRQRAQALRVTRRLEASPPPIARPDPAPPPTALALLVLLGAGAIYLVLLATVFAPADRHGAQVVHLTVHSHAVGDLASPSSS